MGSEGDENEEFAAWLQRWRREVQSRVPVEHSHREDTHLPGETSLVKRKAIIGGAVPKASSHENSRSECEERRNTLRITCTQFS